MVFIALGFHRIVCKTIVCKESTKLRAQRAENVLRCLRTLRACVLVC